MNIKSLAKNIIFLFLFLSLVVFGRYCYLNYPLIHTAILHIKRAPEVEKMASRIRIGMTQTDVEKIFSTKDGGISPLYSNHTPPYVVYFERPDIKIKIHYDEKKTVNGPVVIYKELAISD